MKIEYKKITRYALCTKTYALYLKSYKVIKETLKS